MAKLSPVFQDAQFDSNGNLLVGGKIYTYVAGSSTPLASYTDEAGGTAQSNPIILNARGEVDDPIWLTEGQSYKLRLFDAANNFIREFDDITGVGDNSVTLDQWIASGVTPTYVSPTQFTLPGDQTSAFAVNRRIKATVTAGTVYGYISVSAYTSLTTVTAVLDSGSLDAGLSAVQLGLITPDNTSIPQIPDWVTPEMFEDNSVTSRAIADSALGFALINGTLTASVASNALTIAIKTKAGNDPSATDPVLCVFRSSTLTDGAYVKRSITAATSLVISSGSTLGTANGVQSQLNILAIDNAGTVELAVTNNAGALNLDETGLISTTTEGGVGGADSINTIYSTTARSNVAYRNVGFVVSTQATAGAWVSDPAQIQLISYQPKRSEVISGTARATTSGTAINITGIPDWISTLVITWGNGSTSGASPVILQIRDSGGLETTNYSGSFCAAINSNDGAGFNQTNGFAVSTASAVSVIHSTIVLTRLDPATNTWAFKADTAFSSTTVAGVGAGTKSLSGTLDGFTLTTAGGTDTFDAGSLNWMGW